MQGRFELRDEEYRCPEYGGIDWRERYLSFLALHDVEMPGSLWFVVDEWEQELNEENTMLFQNSIAPELDAVAILDQRDNKPFWWHRIRYGEEYEELVQLVGGYACVFTTDFPLEQVVNSYQFITDWELAKELDEL